MICLACKKLFEKKMSEIKRSKTGRHFCSRSCAQSLNNKNEQRNPPKKRTCKRCQSHYKTSSNGHRSIILCPACSSHYQDFSSFLKSLTLDEYWKRPSVKGKHPSWKNSNIRANCRSWNKGLMNLPCQKCGYSKHVELAHIQSISNFPPTTTVGEVNHPSNLLVLCRNHHWEFDNGHLPLTNIPPRTAD